MKPKEKMDISKVLRIIFIRSFTYLSLLVIVIFVILYLKNANRPYEPTGAESKSKKAIAIFDGRSAYKEHIKGLRDGLLYKGLNVPCIEYVSLEDIPEKDFLYIFGTEKVKLALESFPDRQIVGYAGFNEKPSPHYTGIFSGFDWKQTIKLYQTVLPQLKTLGILYTKEIIKSKEQYQAIEKVIMNEPTLEIKSYILSQEGKDLKEKLELLLSDNIDAFLGIIQDKNIEKGLSVISASCLNHKIPFLGGGKKGAQMGSLISLEYNQELLGRKAAEIIFGLIKEQKTPDQIPINFPKPDIFINLSTSYKLNIHFPPTIHNQAKEKYH